MTDQRPIATEAVQQLDRLSAVILDDLGDGPKVGELVAAASAARDAVGKLGVAALAQVAGLVSGVAESLASSAIEWNPAIGGTLMATVDDLRQLAGSGTQLSEEDSEHLHHRASDLSQYVVVGSAEREVGSGGEKKAVGEPADATPSSVSTPASPVASPPLPPPHSSLPTPQSPPPTQVVPISDLFYTDNGPHIVSGGTSKEAAGRSDLLGRGIEALDNLTMKPIATQMTFGTVEVVPVDTLLYRGRAALERAAAIREQIKASGGVASPATLDEMYDLIGLALKD
jgi:hypothetical protein